MFFKKKLSPETEEIDTRSGKDAIWMITAILFTFLLGFILLGAGYAIALTIQGILSSLIYFFSAALLVLLGTYLLYISFSIFILKLQRGNEKYYYKPTHFLSVSGLLYRMKANAVSLASVSILSTGVLITLSATAAIYSTIQKTVDNVMPRQYSSSVELPQFFS